MSAEDDFRNEDYENALTRYRRVRELEPDYAYILTLIGDALFVQQKYEQAKHAFEQAIERNFIDYQAHWFLADTEWELGTKESALKHMTVAHLLNVNHAQIVKKLQAYRNSVGRAWKSWEFIPQYDLSQEGNTVRVRMHEEWLGYALVKAIWKYEPGYAEQMAGSDYQQQTICFPEEKEALVSLIAQNAEDQTFSHIQQIVEDGFVNEFIIYEIAAKQAPHTLLLLPPESFMKFVEYVETYH